MSAAPEIRRQRLEALQETAREARERFEREHGAQIEAYRQEISRGIDEALEQMQREIAAISADNPVCAELTRQAGEYISWMKWALWDLPFFAVALQPPHDLFRAAVTACGLVYLSIRIFDDVVDQHFWYKGRHPTLLAGAADLTAAGDGARREGTEMAVLAGLLVCFEGLARLGATAGPSLGPRLERVIGAVRRTVIGAIMEYTPPSEWSHEYYERMVALKNVAYWEALYSALDPELASPLYPFLQQYYALAQHLNDVQDFDEDQQAGQPNLLSLYLDEGGNGSGRACPPVDEPGPSAAARPAPAAVEERLAAQFLALGNEVEQLPEPERSIALLKLSESLEAAADLGLFAAPEPLPPPPAADPHLYWYSDLQSVVAQMGSEALERVPCGVCGGEERATMFRKNGFAYHRCQTCSHIYVSPRVRGFVRAQMREELDLFSADDTYLEVQRFHAEWLCTFLRDRAPGARLLDIGFGRGYLMRLAQAHGFEVYGLDSSQRQVDGLSPYFGQRVARVVVGEEEIPWQGFDLVVMSHVLEHLPEPAAVLEEVRGLLNPGGLLYLAVPDMQSMHFKLFGKRWDVVNPLVHFQYFTHESLTRLVEQCGFDRVERVNYPSPPDIRLPRWARLMRHFGGSESSELALLSRVDGQAQGEES